MVHPRALHPLGSSTGTGNCKKNVTRTEPTDSPTASMQDAKKTRLNVDARNALSDYDLSDAASTGDNETLAWHTSGKTASDIHKSNLSSSRALDGGNCVQFSVEACCKSTLSHRLMVCTYGATCEHARATMHEHEQSVRAQVPRRCPPVCTLRGSGSAKPSPRRSRKSAQCILDVINLKPEPMKEGEVEESEKEDMMLRVLCRA